jgi:hypothetical protein
VVDDRFDEKLLAAAWGVPSKDSNHKPTLHRLQLRDPRGNPLVDRSGNPVKTSALGYLGYGCMERGNLVRPAITSGTHVGLRILGGSKGLLQLSGEAARLAALALWAWLNLGGIGARSRNGFGSLRCVAVDGASPFVDASTIVGEPAPPAEGFVKQATQLLRVTRPEGSPNGLPEWTHFSPRSRILRGAESFSTWDQALARAGAWLIAFRRRYGYPGDPRLVNGAPLAGRDYAWAAPRAPQCTRRKGFPDRAGFGLPLPFGEHGETVSWTTGAEAGNGDRRRASPLLIHVAQFAEGFVPVLTHLPARLLSPGGQLRFKNHASPQTPPGREQETVVDRFLDDLAAKKLVREVVA